MLPYCLKCKKKNTESINPKVCGSQKSKFIKKHEAKGLLSSLHIITPLSKIPLSGDVFLAIII